MSTRSAPSRLALLRIAGLSLAAVTLAFTFRNVDLNTTLNLVRSLGPWILVGWSPFLLACALDIVTWQRMLALLGARAPVAPVAASHFASEATLMSIPLGVVVSEPLRPFLLHQRAGVEVPTAVAVTVARKYLLIAAEGVSVGLACLVGAGVLTQISPQVLYGSALTWIAWATSALLLVVAIGYAALLRGGGFARLCFRALSRVVPRRWQGGVQRLRAGFDATDVALVRFFRAPWRELLPAFSAYVALWLLEAAETYLLLRLLGAEVSWQAAFCMEALLSFLRAVVSLLPAGLGVQELGYLVFLRALGIVDAPNVAAAFALLKRGRELLWILVGYACLADKTRRPAGAIQPEAV